MPASRPDLKAGTLPLFEDERVSRGIEQAGGVRGKRVIELGPLEGGHTFMLEKAGASSILSIEADRDAYLRCLVVKEVLGLARARFLLGDFVEHLRVNRERFDLCLASGVLYHMPDPADLIRLISTAADRVLLWTHYYDADLIQANASSRCRQAPSELDAPCAGGSLPQRNQQNRNMKIQLDMFIFHGIICS